MQRHQIGVLVLACLAACSPAFGQAWAPMWINQFGTTASDRIEGGIPDANGGALWVGSTGGTMSAPAPGGGDAFVARSDASGAIVVLGQYGTPQSERAQGVASDGAGGVLLAGETDGSFGGPNLGESDIFVARIDSGGQLLWVRQFGSSKDEDAWDATSDGAGGIYIVGTTWGDLASPIVGSTNAFIARYDGEGNHLWSTQFGPDPATGSSAGAHGACSDEAGGVFVCGRSSGNLGGLVGPFIARYGPTGDRLWVRQVGRTSADSLWAVASDGSGGVIAGGSSVDPTFVTASDIMLVRFSAEGLGRFFTLLSSPRTDSIDAMVGDGTGGAYFSGTSFDRPAGFAGAGRGLFGRVNAEGTLVWGRMFGSTVDDEFLVIASANNDALAVGGVSNGALGPAPVGGADALVARYSLCDADLTSIALVGHALAGVPDGVVNGDDFFHYLTLYSTTPPVSPFSRPPDITTSGTQPGNPGYGKPDGVVSTDDFFYFIALFARGC